MEDLTTENGVREKRLAQGKQIVENAKAAARAEVASLPMPTERSKVVGPAPNVPKPPFWGARVKKDFDLREVFKYVN